MIATFPNTSKLWIFQSDKRFSTEQIKRISDTLYSFLKDWQTHGKDLVAAFEIKYNQFIVIAANESVENPTGCSIDSLTHKIKEIENTLNIKLLDRSLVAFSTAIDKESIEMLPLVQFKKNLKENLIPKHAVIFNNTVSTVGEYQTQWIQPLHESWAKSYL